jgi:nicotinamide-nucleotide amidase
MANLITAKILTVGDEILIGQIVNTNASYLSEKLYSRGFKIVKVVTVGDNEKDLLNELRDSLAEVDITIITGGLGPTHDDITKPVFTDFFGDTLIRDEEVLSKVISISLNAES